MKTVLMVTHSVKAASRAHAFIYKLISNSYYAVVSGKGSEK